MNDHHPLVLIVDDDQPLDWTLPSLWFHAGVPDLLISLTNRRLARSRHLWIGLGHHTFHNRRLYLDLRGSPLNFQ